VAKILRKKSYLLSLILKKILLVLSIDQYLSAFVKWIHNKKTLARTIVKSTDIYFPNSNYSKTHFTLHFDPITESISLLVKYYSEYYEGFISNNNA
jgi:hypothetical protein